MNNIIKFVYKTESLINYCNEKKIYLYNEINKNLELEKYLKSLYSRKSEDELYGDGNASFFRYRISDNRIGRFFAVDPLAKEYPWNSVYAFSENRVVDGVEVEGLEWRRIQDESGRSVDFKWDPVNAYDEAGKLKADYVDVGILFYEKNSNIPAGEIKTFHAIARVHTRTGEIIEYQATTLPSHTEKFGTVAEGYYIARRGQHPMHPPEGKQPYEALNVYTVDGRRELPAIGDYNPKTKKPYVTGVNVHKTGKGDYLGLTSSGGAYRRAVF